MHVCVRTLHTESNENNRNTILCDRILPVCLFVLNLEFSVIDQQHIEVVGLVFFSCHKVYRYTKLFNYKLVDVCPLHTTLIEY